MNDQLQNILAEMLQKALNVAEKTGEFALDMAPELVYQFLVWEAIVTGAWLIAGLILLFYVPRKIYHMAYGLVSYSLDEEEKEKVNKAKYSFVVLGSYCSGEEPEGIFICGFMAHLSRFVGFIMTMVNIVDLLQIALTPEMYLIRNILNI